jgi:hypothetical protein
MTTRQKNRKADALLCAAKHWQNGAPRGNCCFFEGGFSSVIFDSIACDTKMIDWTSAALSEVEWGLEIETEDANE